MRYIKSFATTSQLEDYLATAGNGTFCLEDRSQEYENSIVYSYSKPHDYLTFTAVDAGATVKHSNKYENVTAEYSLDGGNTWTNAIGVTVTLTNVGDKVKYRGVISGDVSIIGGSIEGRFVLNNSKRVAASGSIMSMYNNNPDDTVISYKNAFSSMFAECRTLTTPPELPATTLSEGCYGGIGMWMDWGMFHNCTALTTAPELPAISVPKQGYCGLFYGCTALTTAPELPATSVSDRSYNNMFSGCTSLVNGPEILPALSIGFYSYNNMFSGCTSLVNGPEIMAESMTGGNAVSYMFQNCTSLTSVTHHIKNWFTTYSTYWLNGVASSGTVTCPAASTIPANNDSGIPTGWTRVDL